MEFKRMRRGDYESMCFDLKNYCNLMQMWEAIGQFMRVLSYAGYIAVVHPIDAEIVCIEYQFDNAEIGAAYPVWVSSEDLDSMVFSDEVNEE